MLDGTLAKGQRSILRKQVVEAIRAAIASGTLAPGQRLVEADIAEVMGISKAPVREALRDLVAEGLITSSPHKGSSVTRLTPADVKELFLLRSAIERLAVGLLVDHPSSEALADLQAAIEKMHAFEKSREPAALAEADIRFHELILSHCGVRRLAALWDSMQGMMRIIVGRSSLLGSKIGDAAGRHSAILAAIEQGDRSTAQALLEEHILDAGDRMEKALEETQRAPRADGV